MGPLATLHASACPPLLGSILSLAVSLGSELSNSIDAGAVRIAQYHVCSLVVPLCGCAGIIQV